VRKKGKLIVIMVMLAFCSGLIPVKPLPVRAQSSESDDTDSLCAAIELRILELLVLLEDLTFEKQFNETWLEGKQWKKAYLETQLQSKQDRILALETANVCDKKSPNYNEADCKKLKSLKEEVKKIKKDLVEVNKEIKQLEEKIKSLEAELKKTQHAIDNLNKFAEERGCRDDGETDEEDAPTATQSEALTALLYSNKR
jgi:predicted  nucleic acid-binding Zn-ribbon protein